jgi:methyl-accepting chemotaxis protein
MLRGVKAGATIRRIPKPLLALIALVVAAAIAGPLLLSDESPFEELEDLERAQESSEEAADRSDRIRKSLEEIANNLKAGAGLSSSGDRIEELTSEQRRSLLELVDVLETQLGVLDRSSKLVDETTGSTETLADISETQAENLEDTIDVLRNIEDLAAEASGSSADLARQARYGARLAEDSKDAFRP